MNAIPQLKNNIFDILPYSVFERAKSFFSLPRFHTCDDVAINRLQLNEYIWHAIFNLSEEDLKDKSIELIIHGLKLIYAQGSLTQINHKGVITFPQPKGLNYNLLYRTWSKLPYHVKIDKKVRDFMASKIKDWNDSAMFAYLDHTITEGSPFDKPDYSTGNILEDHEWEAMKLNNEEVKNLTQDEQSDLRDLMNQQLTYHYNKTNTIRYHGKYIKTNTIRYHGKYIKNFNKEQEKELRELIKQEMDQEVIKAKMLDQEAIKAKMLRDTYRTYITICILVIFTIGLSVLF